MRGYRILKASNQLNKIKLLKEDLTNATLFDTKKSSIIIFGKGLDFSEVICKQYLFTRTADLSLHRKLLCAVGSPGNKVVHHIPSVWRQVLRNHGFRISEFRSEFCWRVFQLLSIFKGIYFGFRGLSSGLSKILKGNETSLFNSAYFSELTSGNIPGSKVRDSYDIISWYNLWDGKSQTIDNYCHSVKDRLISENSIPVKFIHSPITFPAKLDKIFQFVFWIFIAGLRSVIDLLRGHWWHPLMFSESVLARIVHSNSENMLAKEYLFNNAVWLYRPLWTYEAEHLGAKVIMYFYSTNIEDFKRVDGYSIQANSWQILTWPTYLVWDQFQLDFLSDHLNYNHESKIVGPIWFSDNAKEIPLISTSSVAVFDITPHRISRYITLGLDLEYYVPEVCNKFLEDISIVTKQNSSQMVWKRKRNIGSTAHSSYRYFAEKIASQNNVIIVDPDISAFRVIRDSKVVISMPFTSTALVARNMGKPSCYYDPSGIVQKDDKASHGIEVVSGISELEKWLHLHLFQNQGQVE